MQAHAQIVAAAGAVGHTQLTRLAGDGPLTVRPTGSGGRARVHLVAGAFGPLGGDELTLEVTVGPGAQLEVAGVAAMVVMRSRDAKPSRLRVRVDIAAGARLLLALPPTVVAVGASHTIDTQLAVSGDGVLVLREETVRGRSCEAGGDARLLTRLDVDGYPVLRQTLDLCGTVGGPWRPRAVGTLLLIGPGPPTPGSPAAQGIRAAWLTLPRDAGHQLTAVGHDPLTLRGLLDAQLPRYTV